MGVSKAEKSTGGATVHVDRWGECCGATATVINETNVMAKSTSSDAKTGQVN